MKTQDNTSFKQFILDDLGEIVLPTDILIDTKNDDVEVPQDPRFQIAKRMEGFVARVGKVSHSFLKLPSF